MSSIVTRRRLAHLGVLLAVTVCISVLECGCCKFHSAEIENSNRPAREWLRAWSGKYNWVEFAGWKDVAVSSIPMAESLLRDRPSVPITEAQVLDLLGESGNPRPTGGTPYLLRAVGAVHGKLPLAVFVRADGDVWVGGEAISRCNVPLQRRAGYRLVGSAAS